MRLFSALPRSFRLRVLLLFSGGLFVAGSFANSAPVGPRWSISLPFGASTVLAEEPPPAETLPPGVPPLPSPRDRTGLLLIADAIEPYKDLLVPPLYDWVKQRKLVFRAVRGLDHFWKIKDVDPKAPAGEPHFRLTAENGIERIGDAADAAGLPFGSRDQLNGEQDVQLRAEKILWNVRFMEHLNDEMRYTFELSWSGSQILRRRASAFFYERFFGALDPEQPFLDQWVLRFIAPPPIQNYSILSWEFRDATRSRFWIFSPPIQRLRELLPANRSDGILGSSLAADDLFVWSGDPRRFHARVIAEKTVFAFFPSLRPYLLVPQAGEPLIPEVPPAEGSAAAAPSATPSPEPSKSGGLPAAQQKTPSAGAVSAIAVTGFRERPFGGGSTAVLWNYDAKQYPQLAPWLPVSVFAVPRKVWEIELIPKDPFYEAGREMLYVDEEMMLPVLKVGYDHIGELRKTVFGGWGLGEKKDRSAVFPFFAFAVAVEQGEIPVTTISATSVRKIVPKENAQMKVLRSLLQTESYGKPRETPAEKKPAAAGSEPKKSESTAAEERSLAID